jgi:hypothetical protein
LAQFLHCLGKVLLQQMHHLSGAHAFREADSNKNLAIL